MADGVQRAHQAGKWVGMVGGSPEVVRRFRAMGFDFVAIASDLGLLMQAATGAIDALRADGAPAATAGTRAGY